MRVETTGRPRVQIAVDVTDLDDALALVDDAVSAGADWIELGNPLIKFQGMRALGAIRKAHPEVYLVADLMILAGSGRYVTAAKDIGIDNVTVSALAPDYTVEEAISLGREHDVDITVDLFNKENPVDDAIKYERLGAPYVMVHIGADEKRLSTRSTPAAVLKDVVDVVDVPVAYATYDVEEAAAAVDNGASVIVQGAPLIFDDDRHTALRTFVRDVHERGQG